MGALQHAPLEHLRLLLPEVLHYHAGSHHSRANLWGEGGRKKLLKENVWGEGGRGAAAERQRNRNVNHEEDGTFVRQDTADLSSTLFQWVQARPSPSADGRDSECRWWWERVAYGRYGQIKGA